MIDRDEFRDQVSDALFSPGLSIDQAVERIIAVVVEQIAQAIETPLPYDVCNCAYCVEGEPHPDAVRAAATVRKFKERSND